VLASRLRRVLGLLAGLLPATLLLLAGLLLTAALLVLTALAGVLRVLWILVHATLSSCPSPNSIARKVKAVAKQKFHLFKYYSNTTWLQRGYDAMRRCIQFITKS
jgi:hypothetical protein